MARHIRQASSMNRRSFIVRTGAAALAGGALAPFRGRPAHADDDARVSIVTGEDRREMAYQVLKPLEREIRRAIGDKQVVIKPNCVWHTVPLSSTHPDTIRGVLDFLEPFYRKTVIIGESTTSPEGTMTCYRNYVYLPLADTYDVTFTDLNTTGRSTPVWIADKNHHPVAVRVIDTFLDPDVYFISVTRLKTHDFVVATLSIKNMVMAAPLNEYTVKNDKPLVHQGHKAMNWNMFQLSRVIRPQLAVLDGVEGMEGNGPVSGTAVAQGVMLAGTDALATDRIGTELMGIDFDDVGYLTHCARAGYGVGDRDRIRILGPDPSGLVMPYRMHDSIEEQLSWKS